MDQPQTAAEQGPQAARGARRTPGWGVGAGMAITFTVTFLFRFHTAAFLNDHFTHLSRAREIVHGEWPIRDFFDPGQFLHYYMSAAAQVVFGYNLFGEALLTAFFIAVGTAITYGVSWRLSSSHAVAAAVTLLAVASFPRLYNYPKIFLYAAAAWFAWWYAHDPARRRIRVLAAFTVVAFLFRYDHGVYVAFLILLVQGLLHFARPRQWLAASGAYLALCGVMLVPFALYVQWATGLGAYVTASLTPAHVVQRRFQSSTRVTFSSLNDWNAAVARSLKPPEEEEEHEPLARFETTFHAEALSSFYAIAIGLPFVALLMVGWAWRRGSIDTPGAVTITALAIFCVLLWRTMMVDNPDARLADISPPLAILGAWVGGRWLAPVWTGAFGRRARVLTRLGVAMVFLFTAWSVSTQAGFLTTLVRYRVIAPPRIVAQEFVNTWDRLRLRPIYDWAPGNDNTGIRALAHYVMRCTEPDDRLLIAGTFAPEIYFYTERLFAGGQVHFMRPWHTSLPEQRLTITHLQHQNVPIALIVDQQEFQRDFFYVSEYVRTRFVEVAYSGFDEYQKWHVLVDRHLTPVGVDRQLGLPCYRRSPED